MNAADVVVLVVFAALILIGLKRGLVGLALVAVATALSLVVAIVAAYVVASADLAGWASDLVAPLAFVLALAVSSWLLRSVASVITGLLHKLPLASVDRVLGAGLALVLGSVVLSLLILGLALVPADNPVTDQVKCARTTPWILRTGLLVSSTGARYAQVLAPLAERYDEALHDELDSAL